LTSEKRTKELIEQFKEQFKEQFDENDQPLKLEQLGEGHAIEQAAHAELQSFFLRQHERKVPPLVTAVAAAMLIGKIFGLAARDAEHLRQGLNQMISLMLVLAADVLAQREEKH
jgi:hypothetical protein